MIEPEKLDTNSPTANMYGCQPCPKCGNEYRYPQDGLICCDECGYEVKFIEVQ